MVNLDNPTTEHPLLNLFLERKSTRGADQVKDSPFFEIESLRAHQGILFSDLDQVKEALLLFGTAGLPLQDGDFLWSKLWMDTEHAAKHMIPSTFALDSVEQFIQEEVLEPFEESKGIWQGFFEHPHATAFTHCVLTLERVDGNGEHYLLHIEPYGDEDGWVEKALARQMGAKRIIESIRICRCEV